MVSTGRDFRSTPSSDHIHGPTSPDIEITPVSSSSRDAITPVERPEKSPPTDLEVRLDTARAVDLFTMKPKVNNFSWSVIMR